MSRVKIIETQIGALSNTSKMPAFSWGISAKKCVTGSKLAKIKGTICNKCYALKNRYVTPIVFQAHEKRRYASLEHHWVSLMSELIQLKYKNLDASKHYFRWFDAGDIQDITHLKKIFQICRNTPKIKHWLATREYKLINQISADEVPPNLCLRVSTVKTDRAPIKWWQWTSGVHKDEPAIGFECPAPKQQAKCGTCRACWDHKVPQISYHEH